MSFIPGQQLDCLWDKLDEHTKERICHETWGMIFQWGRGLAGVDAPHVAKAVGYHRANGSKEGTVLEAPL
jgi:hypothetical protein